MSHFLKFEKNLKTYFRTLMVMTTATTLKAIRL